MMAFGTRRFVVRAIFIIIVLLLVVSFLLKNSFINESEKKSPNKATEELHVLNPKVKLKKRNEVDLVIVEEHHEVLEYWFTAVKKGIIPKSGNILLHIDAHSDMAPPENVEGYPFFRYPKNKDEIRAMMQSNDVFIQAAAMSGFFKKVIWVWPSWDERSHDEADITRYFGGGWTPVTIDGRTEKAFCECEFKKDGVTKKGCQYLNRTAFINEDYEGSHIDPKLCKIKEKIEYQEIAAYNALKKIASGDLVKEGESLLLDIDEDFFGCVLRGNNLVNVGVLWKDVEEIDDLLNEIFCPQAIEHEGLSNDFMQMVIKLIIQICKMTKKSSKACAVPHDPLNKDFTMKLNKIVKLVINKQLFCEMKIKDRERKMSLLVENFLHLNVEQLRAFAEMGFCMQTSPRSFETPGFQLCHGANEPNSTVVNVHMPQESEVKLQLSRIRRIVQAENYPTPAMVTLCRSVRDGYTPVRHFEDIEKNIIKSIKKSRPGVQYKVVYDINLLGGKEGWPSRDKEYNLPNLTKVKRVINVM